MVRPADAPRVMQNFYVTYPRALSRIVNCFSIVKAFDYKSALKEVRETRGTQFGLVYTEEQWLATDKNHLVEIAMKHPRITEECEI